MSEYIDNVRLNGVSIPIRDSDAQQKIAQMEQLSTGNGIESAVLNADYTLTLGFTDGTSYTSPSIRGAAGQGLPTGGSTGQAMVKRSADDQDAEWKTLNGGMVTTSALDSTPVSEAIGALESGLAIISNGNTHGNIQAGQFVYVMNHDTLGAGLYTATANIAQNAALSASNLTAVSGGGLNALSSTLTSTINGVGQQQDLSSIVTAASGVTINNFYMAMANNIIVFYFILTLTSEKTAGSVLVQGLPVVLNLNNMTGRIMKADGTNATAGCFVDNYGSNIGVAIATSDQLSTGSWRGSVVCIGHQ